LPAFDLVVAADRGAQNASVLGLVPDLVVGDMDSIDTSVLASLEALGTRAERHPADKDQTDLELGLASVMKLGASSVTIVATTSGRPDHALANLLTAASDRWKELRIDLILDSSRAWIVRHQLNLDLPVGSIVSLMAVGGPATGITTAGLRWPLSTGCLEPGMGRGLSNEVSKSPASIRISAGTLMVIAP
jgi:thiamine pyrophosphokinase